jgi:ferric-dicitrate binding protein FerR (iron transport regulator)
MISEHYADSARRWIRRLRPEAPPRLPGDRRRMVAAVEEALRARRRRLRVVRSVTVVSAAAAAVVLIHFGLPNQPWRRADTGVAQGMPPAVMTAPDARALTVLSGAGAAGGGMVLGGDVPQPVTRGMALAPGTQLVAPESGDVRIGTAAGTLLTLEPGGTLTVTEATRTQRFALLRGAVRARVAKLLPGERFIIDSADAEIEVHGTAFRVALAGTDPGCAERSTTRVSVSEGVVTVRSGGHEVRLSPGQEWPEGCAPPLRTVAGPARPIRITQRGRMVHGAPHAGSVPSEEPAPAEQPLPAPELPTRAAAPAAPAPVAAPVASAPAAPGRTVALPPPATVEEAPVAPIAPALAASHLAAQNDLFAAAMRAKRAGRDTEAIRFLTRLVKRYPDGPLTESALAQRMKLLADSDPFAGAEAATQYLARFPGGFARADAERLVAGAPAKP